jgi:hypothetical protein
MPLKVQATRPVVIAKSSVLGCHCRLSSSELSLRALFATAVTTCHREKTCSPRTGRGRRTEGSSGSGLCYSPSAERGQDDEPFTDAQDGVEPAHRDPPRPATTLRRFSNRRSTGCRRGDLKGYSPPPEDVIVGPELWLPAA